MRSPRPLRTTREACAAFASSSPPATVLQCCRPLESRCVSAPTIYRRCADGQLPHIRIGDHGPIRIPTSQLERLYDQGVSDDGFPAGSSFDGTDPVERRESQHSGQSSSQAHAGQGQ